MKFAVGLFAGIGVLLGRIVNVLTSLIVWTVSGTARLLIRPFSG